MTADGWNGMPNAVNNNDNKGRINYANATSLGCGALDQQSVGRTVGSRPTEVVCITVLTGNRLG